MVKKVLSEEQIKLIKERIKNGDKYSAISFDLRVPVSTIKYNIIDEFRENKKKYQRGYQRERYKNVGLTLEQRIKKNNTSKKRFKERYNNDEEFRKKHIEIVKEYNKKKRKKK
jgi:hypothetical protein